MTTVTNDFSAMARLQAAFEAAPAAWHDEMVQAAEENNNLLRQALEEEPPQEHLTRQEVYGAPFQSERQRRWFFAALRAGEIEVPYVRTNELALSWTSGVQANAEGVWGQVWTELESAKWVEDSQWQSMLLPYWQTVQGVSEEARGALVQRYALAARNVHRRMLVAG